MLAGMVRRASLLLALVLAVGIAWHFLSDESAGSVSCSELSPPPVVVAFGDSLVAGQGAATDGGFVSLLSARSGVPIHNLGKGGDTTEAAAARVPSALALKPDIVLVLLGGNDALRKAVPEATARNLDSVLGRFKDAGAQVVLLGVPGGLPLQDPYPAMFEELAEKHDTGYLPNVLSGLLGRSEYMSDAVHPNEAGYARIAERALPVLEEACGRWQAQGTR